MFILRDITIKHKLMVIVMTACFAGLAIAGAAFIVMEQNTLRRNMAVALSMRTAMLAENCKAALAFQDEKDAQKILQSLYVDPSITFGGIYDERDGLFAAYYHNGHKIAVLPPAFKKAEFKFSPGFVTVSNPITLDGQLIGTVCLQSDLALIWTMLRRIVLIIIVVIAIALLAVFFISSWLQGIVSNPILNLAKLAKDVSANKDYSVRALKETNDEIGLFVDAFNGMLEQIQKRDLELFNAKEELEIKVQERTAELAEMVDKLEGANKELKNFVYIASHDLREPLRKITAFGAMLASSLKDKLSGDDAENFKFMIDGAQRMTKMIEGLLVYSRVSTQAQPSQDVNLNEIVAQLQQLELSVLLEEKAVTIEVPQPLPTVKADPTQLRQLMQNLIANGIKYQKNGNKPHITITSKPAADGMVRVEVSDNGIGIKPEFQGAIFTMFKRLHSRSEYEGTGIGLAVCKKIVERHGGKIGVESQPDKGSTFWFAMPLAEKLAAVAENKSPVADTSVR